jgi:hypothetical protein
VDTRVNEASRQSKSYRMHDGEAARGSAGVPPVVLLSVEAPKINRRYAGVTTRCSGGKTW